MNRHQDLLDFLNQHLTQEFRIESLAGDASFRRYHRIFVEDTTYLLMDAPPNKESVTPFVHVDEILHQNVNVPDIIAKDLEKGFLLLQDFGTTEFAHVITDPTKCDECYTKAFHTLIKLQAITPQALPNYDADKLASEMALFVEWFLPHIDIKPTTNDQALWQRLNQTVIDEVLSQPAVIVHRDYHSRNLMIDKNSDELGVIDFQDAVIGADTYDLVSLVRDAYIDQDESWVMDKIAEFHALKNDSRDLTSFIKDTNIMGVQRHLKVLGIFVRLCKRDGKERYLADIPKVMKDLLAELDWLDKHHHQSVYGEFLTWLKQTVLPNYQSTFGA